MSHADVAAVLARAWEAGHFQQLRPSIGPRMDARADRLLLDAAEELIGEELGPAGLEALRREEIAWEFVYALGRAILRRRR